MISQLATCNGYVAGQVIRPFTATCAATYCTNSDYVNNTWKMAAQLVVAQLVPLIV